MCFKPSNGDFIVAQSVRAGIKIFFKYQSLGNDFIIFDWYKSSANRLQSINKKNNIEISKILNSKKWNQFVIDSCNRHFGIGADGVLILKNNSELEMPECLIFNSDGTQGQLCLNGLRCVTKHLHTHHNFLENFKIKMGHKFIECSINQAKIINKIENADYLGTKTIKILDQELTGHVVNIGNPHFIIFQKTDLNWLKQHGNLIESHKGFENKTNIEFVWQDVSSITLPALRSFSEEVSRSRFNVLFYERGCGITLACSSGAAAIISTLFHLNKIKIEEQISLKMPGGKITCCIDNNKKIVLQANANLVFIGSFSE